MTPPNPSDNSISRRTFVKTSALSVASIAFLGNGVALANEYSNGWHLWSEDFKWGTSRTIEIPGDITDDAAEIVKQAMSKRVNGDPTTSPPLVPDTGVKEQHSEVWAPGGVPENPTKYSAVTGSAFGDNPKMTFVPPTPPQTQGKWLVEFKADFVYRAKYRK